VKLDLFDGTSSAVVSGIAGTYLTTVDDRVESYMSRSLIFGNPSSGVSHDAV